MVEAHIIGSALYALHDKDLKGFITWMEKGTSAIFLFTSGEKAERYIAETCRHRPVVVYRIDKHKAKDFVATMLNAKIEYALIDAPPEHADVWNVHDEEVVRNYAIVDLNLAFVRMTS